MIDRPALSTSIVVGRSKPAARMILRVSAQPRSQLRIGIRLSGRERFVALGGAVLPGHAASEPLADRQHPLEVTNSHPLAFRAQKFPFASSLSASFSNSASASSRFNVAFSRSSSFTRLTSSALRPPNYPRRPGHYLSDRR
jgi:hypothetical protein